MIIENITGDLLKVTKGIVAHQVNSHSVMGSGIALQVKNQFPKVYEAYKEFCGKYSPEVLLGCTQIVKIHPNLKIANIFGQDGYGYGKMYTDYEAVRSAFIKLRKYIGDDATIVSIPYKMGSDRGGGDWEIYLGIITDIFKDSNVTLRIYKYNG